jgi:hypothetical protein
MCDDRLPELASVGTELDSSDNFFVDPVETLL